jgi:hypothetical protein
MGDVREAAAAVARLAPGDPLALGSIPGVPPGARERGE